MDKAYKAFEKFMSMYDLKDEKIKLKYEHTFRVAKLAKEIAQAQNLSEEEIFVSELAGLLHDIGRFEQVKKFNSFDDSETFDHGAFGISVLFDNNLIRYFIEDSRYDDLLKRAIYAHNKFAIPHHYTPKEVLISQVVRDADKIDILHLIVNKPITLDDKPEISPIVIDSLMDGSQVRNEIVHSRLDRNLLTLSFIYDINFKYTLFLIQKHDYLNRMIDRILKIIGTDNQELIDVMEGLRIKMNQELNK